MDHLSCSLRPAFLDHVAKDPSQPCCLFLSASDMQRRAVTRHACADTPEKAWQDAAEALATALQEHAMEPVILRADWVRASHTTTWKAWQEELTTIRLGYMRQGLALDSGFAMAFTEQELNANGILFQNDQDKPIDAPTAKASFNAERATAFCQDRFGRAWPAMEPDQPVIQFSTAGVFVHKGDSPHRIGEDGHRDIAALDSPTLSTMIQRISDYLTEACTESGKFHFVRMPCFDKPLNYYNTIRHLGTVYAMLEAYALLGGEKLRAAIERATAYVVQRFAVRKTLPDGSQAAFFKESFVDEVRLGGGGIGLLLFTKYAQLIDPKPFDALMRELGRGILHMQEADGGFVHILRAKDLTLLKRFSIVFYDGEAVFGLLRLFEITGERIWLDAVQRAFDAFIASRHWRHHDHWLSYACDEMTQIMPEKAYFAFGLHNTTGILNAIANSELPNPTRLEQSMAAKRMITRLEENHAWDDLRESIPHEKFAHALERRALKQTDSFFWPEVAMFFAHPASVVGSVFMRYNAFRVRIDDVQHTLSGLIAYLRWLENKPVPLVLASPCAVTAEAPKQKQCSTGKKDRAIMVTADRHYLFAAGTLIVNLQRNNVAYDSFVIYGQVFDEEEKRKLQALEPRVVFREYSFEAMMQIFGMDSDAPLAPAAARHMQRYSYVTYLKNQCFALLEEYKTVLVLDLDVLIRDNLEELFNTPCNVAWRTGYTFYQKLAPLERSLKTPIAAIPDFSCFKPNTLSPNGGCILLHDNFPAKQVYTDSVTFIKRYMLYFSCAVDELSIGYACYKNALSVVHLNRDVYNATLRFYTAGTKILHFFGLNGKAKPWINPLVHIMFQEWMSCYQEFVTKTGMRSESVQTYGHLGNTVIVPLLHQQHWLAFLARKDFFLPDGLHMVYDFSGESLVLRYNARLSYEFRYKLWERNKMQCALVAPKDIPESLLDAVCDQDNIFTKQHTADSLQLIATTASQEETIEHFRRLFALTEAIRKHCAAR